MSSVWLAHKYVRFEIFFLFDSPFFLKTNQPKYHEDFLSLLSTFLSRLCNYRHHRQTKVYYKKKTPKSNSQCPRTIIAYFILSWY